MLRDHYYDTYQDDRPKPYPKWCSKLSPDEKDLLFSEGTLVRIRQAVRVKLPNYVDNRLFSIDKVVGWKPCSCEEDSTFPCLVCVVRHGIQYEESFENRWLEVDTKERIFAVEETALRVVHIRDLYDRYHNSVGWKLNGDLTRSAWSEKYDRPFFQYYVLVQELKATAFVPESKK